MSWQDIIKSIEYIEDIEFCEYNYDRHEDLLPIVYCYFDIKGCGMCFTITDEDIEYCSYFKEYYLVIYMLILNGAIIIDSDIDDSEYSYVCETGNICNCGKFVFNNACKTLHYNGILYPCSYENIREELKDVIDELLSNQKVAINE